MAQFTLGILEQMKKLPATCLDGRYTIKFDLQGSSWLFLKKGVTQGKLAQR
ncbi:hypothetical protein [Pseudomonas sp. ANT_J28]|uniref:hypothetical protein n=1 Tax=Pseudomonas TaxID=286 RepID=UPI0015B67DBB|nr:hypothetical protein [Pseudomonas sp. ANT_J28]